MLASDIFAGCRYMCGRRRADGAEGLAANVAQSAASQCPHRAHHFWQDGPGLHCFIYNLAC